MYKVMVKVNGVVVAEGNPETLGQARYMAKAFTTETQSVEVSKSVELQAKTRKITKRVGK